MKVVYNDIIPFEGYKAINLFGVVFVRKGTTLSEVDVRHEAIHTEQYKELLYIGFLPLYVVMFIWELIKFRNWHKAYKKVPFEREAYRYEGVVDYLSTRKRYNWINV